MITFCPAGEVTGHIYDFVMIKDGKLEHFEIKNYNGSRFNKKTGEYLYDFGKNIASCLLSSLKAKACKKLPDTDRGGQLFDDFVRIFKKPENIDVTWIFNGVRGGDIDNIKKELFNKIAKDPEILLPHIKKSGNTELLDELTDALAIGAPPENLALFLEKNVKSVINQVFQQGKNLADINQ